MSKKTPPKGDIERARGLLHAPGDDASADLAWARKILAGQDEDPPGEALRPEVAYALVEELTELRRTEILARLAAAKHKAVSKAARTALHHLRSHKLEVDVPGEATESHEGTGLAARQSIRSLATIYDSRWERLVWLGEDAPSGLRVHQARTSAFYGLLDLKTGVSTRKEYRAKTREILQDLGGEMVDHEEGRWLVEDAALRCQEAGRSLPRGYALASQGLGPPPGGEHPALRLEPDGDPDALEALLDLPELRYWNPDRDFLHSMALKIDEVQTSQLVLTEIQRRERLSDVVDRAVVDFYTEQRRRACRCLLLDTAHLLAVRGGPALEQATTLRTAADLFNKPPDELVAHPFPRRFVERVVNRLRPKEDEEPQEPEEQRSDSGLIIP